MDPPIAPSEIPDDGLPGAGRIVRVQLTLQGTIDPLSGAWPAWRERYWSFAVPEWLVSDPADSLFVCCYRAMRVPASERFERTTTLGQVAVVLLHDEPMYLDPGELEFSDEFSGTTSPRDLTRAPLAAYTLLITPFTEEGRAAESAARQRIGSAVGLVALLEGYNAIYKLVFENVIPRLGFPTAMTPAVPNAIAYPRPDWSERRVAQWSTAAEAASRLALVERRRVDLGIRWLQRAVQSRGLDAFLAYWIAIETISMPDDTNIRPLEERLARIYGIDWSVARKRFQIGRIFGLRGAIVHGGSLLPVHDDLLAYLHALAGDLLLDVLALPSEHRLERILQRQGFRLRDHLLHN